MKWRGGKSIAFWACCKEFLGHGYPHIALIEEEPRARSLGESMIDRKLGTGLEGEKTPTGESIAVLLASLLVNMCTCV